MRHVKRTAVTGPSSLIGAKDKGARELGRARTYFSAVPPPTEAFPFKAYKEDDVRHALEALFHGKCAYCEARYEIGAPVDIEHFRPKGEVADLPGHPGYWWLAGHWENLLPSCIDCNRRRYQPTPEVLSSLSAVLDRQRIQGFRAILTGKNSCFPIKGTRMDAEPAGTDLAAALIAEDAYLLDPCVDDPAQHLSFHIDRDNPLGIVCAASATTDADGALPELSEHVGAIEQIARSAGLSARGAVSIQIYGLNRLALVQERTRVLRQLEVLGDIVVQVSTAADDLERLVLANADDETVRAGAIARLRSVVDRTIAEIKAMAAPDAPFSTMVSSWIVQFRAALA
jgi:hypothetical protein